tara:strand:+ start:804 stop:1940 length:1137 start_codon:yes stop_codon:yes gene_type:complete
MNQIKVIIFFTKDMSLVGWDRSGILKRELALYKRLGSKGYDISFITYGNNQDLNYIDQLGDIKVLCNKWGLPKYLYNKYLHIIHRKHLKSCNIIKTNQMFGADIALKSAKFYDKPLINRMGYLLSDAIDELTEFNSLKNNEVSEMQASVLKSAQKLVVTTKAMADKISFIDKKLCTKLEVIPNYVDVDLFYPNKAIEKYYDLLFIGRIVNQKNIESLLKAVSNTNLKVLLIGSGPLKEELMHKSRDKEQIFWLDNVKNQEIPSYMIRSKIFVLPSIYEGHPKVLIEAMSCGMTVLASNVQGNNDVITDGENGFLCDTSVVSIQESIFNVLKMSKKMINLININARQFVKDNYSLDKIVTMEMQLYEDIMNENNFVNLV